MHKWFKFKNEATSDTAEILICDQIGKDWWTGDGIASKEFAQELQKIPRDKKITVLIDSSGGNVWDGLAIHNLLAERRDKVTCRVIGIAASIASVIALAGYRTEIPKSALMMIHNPWGVCQGTAEEMRKCADALDKNGDVIAGVYEGKCKKPKADILKTMAEETWFTGEEAKEYGLVDELIDQMPMAASADKYNLSMFRRVPAALIQPQNKVATTEPQITSKAKEQPMPETITPVANVATNQQSETEKVSALIAGFEARIQAQNKQLETEKRTRITATVQAAIDDYKIPVAQKQRWIDRAMQDEAVLDDIKALESKAPGAEPLGITMVNEDVRNVGRGIMDLSKPIFDYKGAKNQAIERGNLVAKERNRLIPFLNANSVDSGLKRTVILQDVIRAFAVSLMPLRAFSTVFNPVQLEGSGTVTVPYFALNTTSSTSFVAGTGYAGTPDIAVSKKAINVSQTAGGKRYYQYMAWTSAELAEQPYFDVVTGAKLKAEQLAVDIVNDILSVVTLSNYSTAAVSQPTASWDSDKVADLKGVCDIANWPAIGRSLIVNSPVDVALLKDTSFKHALNYGDPGAIKDGQIPRIFGFDYYPWANLPSNSENLIGMAVFKSAILVALASVPPTNEVRQNLTQYQMVVDPVTGIQLTYKSWGDAQMDTTESVIESNYGYAVGEAAALKRCTSA